MDSDNQIDNLMLFELLLLDGELQVWRRSFLNFVSIFVNKQIPLDIR